MGLSHAEAVAADAADPLRPLRDRFHLPDGLVYLDGNSLGALPIAAIERQQDVVRRQWGDSLIRSWNEHQWIEAPQRLGAKIAPLIGARPHEVIVTDSTSVNLFKLLVAAARLSDRPALLSESGNFHTDLHIASGVADLMKLRLDIVPRHEVEGRIGADTNLLLLTHVHYKTAERFDMAVLEAYEPIERRWQDRLAALDVAVDEIPRIAPKDPDSVQWPPEVIADGPIALARLIPAGVDVRGNATRARIVLFRKPIERRAKDTVELEELLHEILVAQVATYLGVEPSVIDPTIDDD